MSPAILTNPSQYLDGRGAEPVCDMIMLRTGQASARGVVKVGSKDCAVGAGASWREEVLRLDPDNQEAGDLQRATTANSTRSTKKKVSSPLATERKNVPTPTNLSLA